MARESDATVVQAHEYLRAGNTDGAIALLNEARQADPDNPRVTLTLAQAQSAAGDISAAEATLDSMPADEQDKPGSRRPAQPAVLRRPGGRAPDATQLAARLAADSEDHQALLQLALRKVVEQDYETAMELLLQLMQKDRSFGDDAGRRTLLKVFELLGDDPRVSRYRRKMASLLH